MQTLFQVTEQKGLCFSALITGEPPKAAAQVLFQVGITLYTFYTLLFYFLIFMFLNHTLHLQSEEMQLVERAGRVDVDGPKDINERTYQVWRHRCYASFSQLAL